MPDLTAAQTARMNAALDKEYRFAHGIDTFRGMIESGMFSHGEAASVPRVQYNRIKFNRMDHRQQAEYEKKLAERKTEYRLFYAGDSDRFAAVPKMVFEFFESVAA